MDCIRALEGDCGRYASGNSLDIKRAFNKLRLCSVIIILLWFFFCLQLRNVQVQCFCLIDYCSVCGCALRVFLRGLLSRTATTVQAAHEGECTDCCTQNGTHAPIPLPPPRCKFVADRCDDEVKAREWGGGCASCARHSFALRCREEYAKSVNTECGSDRGWNGAIGSIQKGCTVLESSGCPAGCCDMAATIPPFCAEDGANDAEQPGAAESGGTNAADKGSNDNNNNGTGLNESGDEPSSSSAPSSGANLPLFTSTSLIVIGVVVLLAGD